MIPDISSQKTLETSDIAKMPCVFYECAATRYPWYTDFTVSTWLDYCERNFAARVYEMRELPYDSPEQKQFKSHKIPAATLSCTCGKKTRSRDNVEKVNPLIVIDIDYHPDKNENVFLADRNKKIKVMHWLVDSGFAYAVGSSCRGTGIWVIVPLASTEIERHFNALIDDFSAHGIILDPSCRDVTRLRLASPDDIIRTPYKTLTCYSLKKDKQWEVHKVQPYRTEIQNKIINDIASSSIPEIIDALIALGYRTEHYNAWCYGAMFHLLPFGQEGLEQFIKITIASNEVRSPGDYRTERQAQEKFARDSCKPSKFTLEECYKYWIDKLKYFRNLSKKQNLTQL